VRGQTVRGEYYRRNPLVTAAHLADARTGLIWYCRSGEDHPKMLALRIIPGILKSAAILHDESAVFCRYLIAMHSHTNHLLQLVIDLVCFVVVVIGAISADRAANEFWTPEAFHRK